MFHDYPTSISARELVNTHEDIVLWGSSERLIRRILDRAKLQRPIKFIFSEAPLEGKPIPGVTVLHSFEQLLELTPEPLVLLTHNHAADLKRAVKKLTNYRISFDHASFYASQLISCEYLLALGFNSYIDLDNNHIKLDPGAKGKIDVRIGEAGVSKNNIIEIGEVSAQDRLLILAVGSSGKVCIGNQTTFVQSNIVFNTEGRVNIGNDCMFARDIELNQSDSHHIFDAFTGKRINQNRPIELGNHVWIGRGVQILAGCSVGSGSIIGAGSITSGHFGGSLVAAGNPAKILREEIVWSRDLIKHASHESIYQCDDQEGLKYI